MPDEPNASAMADTPKRVLIVDDVEQVRRDLHLLLQLAGNLRVVGEAANGVEAIRQAGALRPDVVVIDLEMPVLNGYAATSRIKRDRPECRVVALTIHDGAGEREAAALAGADAFVVKGAAVELLLAAIQGPVAAAEPREAVSK